MSIAPPVWDDPARVAALNAALRRMEQERAYWDAHAAALTKRYPDEFVAVADGQVIAHDPDLLALLSQLDAIGRGVTECWLRFLPGPDSPIVIPSCWRV